MYYIGLFLYLITFLACWLITGIKDMIQQCILLAPEISYTMIGIYIYPLAIFLCHKILKKKSQKNYIFLANQTKLSASVTVSLGLVGTFIGLTGMITAISASLAGEGDVAEKMNAMISSISMALDSMSFAFLTSILGVSISVLLLVSLNFFQFFYIKDQSKHSQPNFEELNDIHKTLFSLQAVNVGIAQKFVSVSEDNQLATEISNTLKELTKITTANLQTLVTMKDAQNDWYIKYDMHLLEEKKSRLLNNEKIEKEILEVKNSIQWIKSKALESKKKLISLLSVE
ncbi:hypothetical protein CO695_02560 [Providencia alcalifaciens]|uniref:MotA/TolQ/ExbB proton channel domain-containing protein n=2 Tax=Providencia alcalifaciens TaxID=126385 RepID=B6XE27_9GAMM|nr:hypothetical protein [Providencia alcalifaciens]ATG15237.1 hypothetical protein CO695_02560 [Providencia alcalifaciens]EEB46305.1 hypothetical protein PROVALCAL_01603 [Providencia alcalifaciens DSM 30120]